MRTKSDDAGCVRKVGRRAALGLVVGCALLAGMLFSSLSANAADLHGISFLKGCNSPTIVGDPYICTFQVVNNVDTAHDTLTITSLVDVVHSGTGDVSSGNVLPTATLVFSGGSSCNVGQTLCTLPYGSSISLTISFYSVLPGDPNPLSDTATLTWQDTCDSGSPNCPIGDLHTEAGSQSEVQTPTPTPTNTFTPTPTATATPAGVGGEVKLPPASVTDTTANDSGWGGYAALASGIVAAVVAVSAGGWYTRRRWLR
jgi:hypothetical protein